ncbi:hypothetical protein RSAG8_09717, partial [Rhizoctonia solani AG-8 WAC10335]
MDKIVNLQHIVGLLHRIAKEVEEATLLKDIDYVEDAITHIVLSVTPNPQEQTQTELLPLLRGFKQYFNNAVNAYDNDREFQHYFNYFLGIGYYSSLPAYRMSYHEKIELLQAYECNLKEDTKRVQREKRSDTRRQRNARLREMSNQLGLRAVGHVDDGRMPFNVLCVDAYTHDTLDNRTMLINGIDNNDVNAPPLPPQAAGSGGRKTSNRDDPTVPEPALFSPFPQTGFVSKDMLVKANFKFFSFGTAVQFSPIGSFNEVEQQAVDVFIDYMALAQHQGYEVKINRAQNGNKARRTAHGEGKIVVEERHGRLLGGGWRPGRKGKEAAGEYSPQTRHDWHNPDCYIGYHEKQGPVSLHGPSLGSNMSVSMNDESGRNFANSMHVDHDIDSLPQYYGKIFTFGQWIHTKNGKLVEGTELRAAIPDGYFALPGYRVAFDLGGAAVVTAIWRGGLDLHGTTTSEVDLGSGITRWGMSIQTNRTRVATRIESGKGAIFGAYDKLRAVYEAVCGE